MNTYTLAGVPLDDATGRWSLTERDRCDCCGAAAKYRPHLTLCDPCIADIYGPDTYGRHDTSAIRLADRYNVGRRITLWRAEYGHLHGDHAFDRNIVPTVDQAKARVTLALALDDAQPGRGGHRATARWGTLHEVAMTRDAHILAAVVAIRERRKHERAGGAA